MKIPEIKKKPEAKKNIEQKFKVLNIIPAALQLLYWGFLGDVKEASAEYQPRGGKENISQYFLRTALDLEFLKENKSLKKTYELYSNEELRELVDFLKEKKFENANFYLDYLSVENRGPIEVYPDKLIIKNNLEKIIVENFNGKLVSSERDAEFIPKIEIRAKKFSDKRTKLIPGFLEIESIEPSLEIEITFLDKRERLRPKEAIKLKCYSQIKIKKLSRKDTGDFDYNELNEAVEEAFGNLRSFLKLLSNKMDFIEASSSLAPRLPTFLITNQPIIEDSSEDQSLKGIYYPIMVPEDFVNYFKNGDELEIYGINEENNLILIEKGKISKILIMKKKPESTIFIKSPNFSKIDELKEKISRLRVKDLFIKKVNMEKNESNR